MHVPHTAIEELPRCTIDDVRDSWHHVVREWSHFVRGGQDVHREVLHGPALLRACGSVRGRRVLDVGCGEGWCSRELAGRGAAVVAVDVCETMVAEASAHPAQEHHPVDYQVMDACDVHLRLGDARFDLAVACMSLHSMPDPAAAIRAMAAVLAPGGRLVCSIPHPFTHPDGGRQIQRCDGLLTMRFVNYFRTAPHRVWWNDQYGAEPWPTVRWSRTLGDYADMLLAAGLGIRHLVEPRATWMDVEQHERLRNASEVPYYLVLVAEPGSSPGAAD